MLDWLIIGGGIQGTALALYLTRRKRIPHDRLRVLDPHGRPLALWKQHTHNTGMEYLRSPLVHHLSDDPFALRTFAQTRPGQPHARYIPLYDRPSLDLFNTYSQQLIERNRLDELFVQGRANGLTHLKSGWRVETNNGSIEAKNVLLAIGRTEQPRIPEWAIKPKARETQIHHLFELGFNRDDLTQWQNAVVIGGGISAAQIAMTLASKQPGTVTLLSRHEPRIHHFDSDPCWVTRLCLEDFTHEPDPNQRRKIIQQARHPGSIPHDIADALQFAQETGLLRVIMGEVTEIDGSTLTLSNGDMLPADLILLATGFESKRPGGVWLDTAIADYDLPVAACGYPVVDETLCWTDGLYVTGPLAELEIGPTSGNIIGTRLSMSRLKAVT